jgi:DNA adenine methylase
MNNCSNILAASLTRAINRKDRPFITDKKIAGRVSTIALCPNNRAGVRLILACMLAKVDQPNVDPRKPYTKIGDKDCFSGRTYDEQAVGSLIAQHRLPCNSTTAFLTPTLRNMDQTLTTKVVLVGRPATLYVAALELLDDVHAKRISAQMVLDETLRLLIIERDSRALRLASLVAALERPNAILPLSSEDIVTIIAQHLACKNSSRLPVLIVAAAYETARDQLRERVLALTGHNAADEQTGAVGDVQITLLDDNEVITCFEMKDKTVERGDIDRALQKIALQGQHVQNYLFITTAPINDDIRLYAASKYDETGGKEIAILSALDFLRYFLHLFHRLRLAFLDQYQQLLLAEPESAVSQPVKETFLVLRQAAESAA